MRIEAYCPYCNRRHKVKVKHEMIYYKGEPYDSAYCFCRKSNTAFRNTDQILADQKAVEQIDDIIGFIKGLEENGEPLL